MTLSITVNGRLVVNDRTCSNYIETAQVCWRVYSGGEYWYCARCRMRTTTTQFTTKTRMYAIMCTRHSHSYRYRITRSRCMLHTWWTFAADCIDKTLRSYRCSITLQRHRCNTNVSDVLFMSNKTHAPELPRQPTSNLLIITLVAYYFSSRRYSRIRNLIW